MRARTERRSQTGRNRLPIHVAVVLACLGVETIEAPATAQGDITAPSLSGGTALDRPSATRNTLGTSGLKPAPQRKPSVHDAGLVEFKHSPYPYAGTIPEQNIPFLQQDTDGRMFHDAPRGGRLYADETYNDRRSLVLVPPAFSPFKANAAIIVFFHGNLATLHDDVINRQGVPRQLLASHLNAALVAPQLAVDALDSSPGHFYEPGFFQTYLHEAEAHLAARSHHQFRAKDLDRLPVIIVAYSGGYVATAFTLHYASRASRIRGVILLDALFGEDAKIRSWVERTYGSSFFIDTYSESSAPLSSNLQDRLVAKGLTVQTGIPDTIQPGSIIFQAAPNTVHNDFVTQAWVQDPLEDVLKRIQIGTPPQAVTRRSGVAPN